MLERDTLIISMELELFFLRTKCKVATEASTRDYIFWWILYGWRYWFLIITWLREPSTIPGTVSGLWTWDMWHKTLHYLVCSGVRVSICKHIVLNNILITLLKLASVFHSCIHWLLCHLYICYTLCVTVMWDSIMSWINSLQKPITQ
jgi:hypothetical protein